MGSALGLKAQLPKQQRLHTIGEEVRDVISLLDTKLCTAVTNIIFAFLDTSSTAKIVLSDLLGTECVDDFDIRQCGDTIEFYTLVDDGKYFHTCKIIWSKSRLDLIWLRDYYNPSTMLMMMNHTDAFHSHHALLKQKALLKQQSHNDDLFMVHTIEATIDVKRHYIVHETSDLGWLLHCINPIRFKQNQCQTLFGF